MDEKIMAWRTKVSVHICEKMEKRGFEAAYSETAQEALEAIMKLIPKGSVVSRGGSESVLNIGLWQAIKEADDLSVLETFSAEATLEESLEMRRQALASDVFLASVNAFTLDGVLVNMDATGNRVAAISYGPRKIILVVGMNKVCPDVDSAMARTKHIAGPINAMRLGYKTPCAVTGICSDCSSPDRICHQWSILEGHKLKGRIHVHLVGEDLGF